MFLVQFQNRVLVSDSMGLELHHAKFARATDYRSRLERARFENRYTVRGRGTAEQGIAIAVISSTAAL